MTTDHWERQMPHPLAYSSAIIYIALTTGFAIDVSARIDRIAQYLMNLRVTWSNPAYVQQCARLQREAKPLLMKPEPHLACGAHLREALEHCPNRAADGLVRMKQYFAVGLAPD